MSADERVRVVEVGKNRGHKRLKQLGLAQPTEEPQCHAADVLIGVVEVVA